MSDLISKLVPILHVADPDAERRFYKQLGLRTAVGVREQNHPSKWPRAAPGTDFLYPDGPIEDTDTIRS